MSEKGGQGTLIMGIITRTPNLSNTGRIGLDKLAEPAERGVLLIVILDIYESLAPVIETLVSLNRPLPTRSGEETYQACANDSRWGATASGWTSPIRPIVTAAFSVKLFGLVGLSKMGTRRRMS